MAQAVASIEWSTTKRAEWNCNLKGVPSSADTNATKRADENVALSASDAPGNVNATKRAVENHETTCLLGHVAL
jgi:hypothetical protein